MKKTVKLEGDGSHGDLIMIERMCGSKEMKMYVMFTGVLVNEVKRLCSHSIGQRFDSLLNRFVD